MRRRDRIGKKFSFGKTSESKQEAQDKKTEKKIEKKSFYYKHYKQLLIIPLIVLFLSLVIIGFKVATTGEFINKGISLKGGTSVTITKENVDKLQLEQILRETFPKTEINFRTIEDSGTQIGVIAESDIPSEDAVLSNKFIDTIKSTTGATDAQLSIETIGVSLGSSFFKQTMIAMVVAFILMAIVVFLYFKTLVPSALVILSAFADIITTIAVLDVLNIKVSTAGIAALLMLIGYSVDTDILLTMRVLKRKDGTIYDQIISSFKTGMMMNIATLAAVIAGIFVAQSPILREIMLIVVIGVLADMIYTWLLNAGLLRLYLEKKGEQ
ncbi:MAG: protein translocase subunit SecF [Candidatus Woesearchaeota archaeon]|jgi:preprotein translocase subunit SecF